MMTINVELKMRYASKQKSVPQMESERQYAFWRNVRYLDISKMKR